MKIIDDVLPKPIFREMRDVMLGHDFPWYMSDGVDFVNDGKRQFFHMFYANQMPLSDHFQFIVPFQKYLGAASLLRVKANLLLKTPEVIKHNMHVDQDIRCKVAVYYLNTNNGYTGFEDGSKVESKENRLVIFDSTTFHHGTTCSDADVRAVINFNYFESDYFREVKNK